MLYNIKYKQSPDSFQAFTLNGATYTNTEEYPIIPQDYISTEAPKRILHFERAINSRNDLSDTYVCFYSPDHTFERIRRNPKKYVNFFKRTAGIIGFDFSIHTDMPIVQQKSQIFDNLRLTYYFGSQGINVIPNIRYGVEETKNEFFEAVPEHSIIAIGTHGFIKEIRQKHEWNVNIDEMVNNLHPRKLIVYGSLPGRMFDSVRANNNVILYEPWINKQYRVNKGGGSCGK